MQVVQGAFVLNGFVPILVGCSGDHTATDSIILNNGSDHLFPQPHIPELINQWNDLFGDKIGKAEQADFEKYRFSFQSKW